jgi:cyanophycin synthetase
MSKETLAILAIRSLPGYMHGFKTASLVIDFNARAALLPSSTRVCRAIDHCMVQTLGLASLGDARTEHAQSSTIVDALLGCSLALLETAKIPLVSIGKSTQANTNAPVQVFIPAPADSHAILSQFAQWFVKLHAVKDQQRLLEVVNKELPKVIKTLKRLAPTGSNIPHFLAAAAELNIPVMEVAGRTLQFGHGKKNRWLDSSFTDQTPYLSAVIARNKVWTAKVLRSAGIPVASHALVNNVDQAVKVAKKLGFPVVVKPADLDGGLAVAAGLGSPEEVSQAFESAAKRSKNILVEKHIAGRDYRLNIFQGELLWAIERVPAGVVGDGKHCVRELLDIVNSDERRGEGVHAKLKKIALDKEALDLLSANNKTPDSVLESGEYVPLRRIANVAAGGMPVSVMGRVHWDNVRLAIRSAAALGLDIAGVDLLMPDISRSWMDVGCAVCEVNGQPQLGSVTSAHVYKEVLAKLIDGDGRIPITLIQGGGSQGSSEAVVAAYASKGLCVGYAGEKGIFVGDECISRKSLTPYRAGKILLRDRRVEALVLEGDAASIASEGLPYDQIINQ